MSKTWARLYEEFAHDPKIQSMSETMQRRFIMIMCLHIRNDDVTFHETEIAVALRISEDELALTKALFIQKGFITETWNLLKWRERQFLSDSSSERVRKHRETKKRFSNDSETFQKRPQIQTQIQKRTKEKARARETVSLEELSLEHNAPWLASKRSERKYLSHDEKFILEYFKNYCQSNGKKYDDYLSAYRNAFEWDSCQPKTTSGGVQNKDDRARAAVMRAAVAGGYATGG